MEAGGSHKAFKAMRIKRESARSADKFSCDWVFALPRTKMLGVGTTPWGGAGDKSYLPGGREPSALGPSNLIRSNARAEAVSIPAARSPKTNHVLPAINSQYFVSRFCRSPAMLASPTATTNLAMPG